MSVWIVVTIALLAWAAVSVAVAVIVGRTIRTRDFYETPLYPPSVDSMHDAGTGHDQ